MTSKPLGIALAVCAAVLFSVGAALQHHGVGQNSTRDGGDPALSGKGFLRLLRNASWLGGGGVVVLGSLLHIVGVSMAPVSVVQPIGTLSVPISVGITSIGSHNRVTRRIAAACVLTIAGVLADSLLAAAHTVGDVALSLPQVLAAAGTVGAIVVVLQLATLRAHRHARALLWAAAAATLYGLSTALMKAMFTLYAGGAGLHRAEFWVVAVIIAACYAAGVWAVQQGYANGTADTVVSVLTVLDPMVAVIFGLAVLREGRSLGLPAGLGMIAGALVAACGVTLLAQSRAISSSIPAPAQAAGTDPTIAPERPTPPPTSQDPAIRHREEEDPS